MTGSEFRTDRLLLREWRDSDRDALAAINADPVVMEHFPTPLTRPQSDALVDEIRTHFAVHGYGLWAVEVLTDGGPAGELAGFTGLKWSDWTGERALEVGWRLAPRWWGSGYATEAARVALDVGLRQVPEVVSFTAVVNQRSQRVMQRLGMRRVREFDHPQADVPPHLRRHVLYATP